MPETGQKISHYRILQKIGVGGMGEVYLAEDLSLDRKVALKFLPDVFTGDPERMARFEREAKLLASLNHPNIAAIYGLEQADGKRFLIMEYVEGETLQARISKGALPLEDALGVCKQIAEGLEAAHEKGVIHRDLKPANVMIAGEEKVKILDFGLAKALLDEGKSVDSSQSPTITEAMTQPGVVLGTAAYMSPEQAKGKSVDKRADIWAFGCILYECLTGKKAFNDETVTETLAAILRADPDWQALSEAAPEQLRRFLRRCLEKDPARRFHSAADVGLEMEDASISLRSSDTGNLSAKPGSGRQRAISLGVVVLVAAISLAAGGIVVWILKSPSSGAFRLPAHVLIDLKPAEHIESVYDGAGYRPTRTAMDFSPDGRSIVFSAVGGNPPVIQLYLRALDKPEAIPLPGTEEAVSPFFSPDGKWIAFWSKGELRKTPAEGGPSVPICRIPVDPPFGACWGPGDNIVFALMQGGLWKISAAGGEPHALTEPDASRGEYSHRLPQILPGGKEVLFTVTKSPFPVWDETQIALQSMDTGRRTYLSQRGADARYVIPGYLIYIRSGVLMAAPFDLAELKMTGASIGVIEDVMQAANNRYAGYESGAAQYSISSQGTVAYLSGGMSHNAENSIVWVDRRGSIEPLPISGGIYGGLQLTPDGRQLVFSDAWHVSIHDLETSITKWLTSLQSGFPKLTPTGTRVAYTDISSGSIFWQPLNSGATAERLTTSSENQFQFAGTWTPDEKTLVFVQGNPTNHDLWALPFEGDRKPRQLTDTAWDEEWPSLSPDGRWLAYGSNETGRFEVYVQRYPEMSDKEQISINGGTSPLWARNGREVFYTEEESEFITLFAVDISLQKDLKRGKPKALFKGRFRSYSPVRSYDVSNDSRRFIMIPLADVPPPPPADQIHLGINWFEELKQKVPVP